jgi:class 3 adenylate cyclase
MRASSSISSIIRVWPSLVLRWRRRITPGAVLAALRLQECLRHTGTALGPGTAQERTVCMSLHTGEVIVGPIGADSHQIALAVGDTTQMADQLLRLAEPGAIVLSAATARLVRDLLRLDPQ